MDGALAGIRVLDLSTVILGPMAAQYLGDLGAEVIKVETPEGDVTRSIGPRRHEGMGALFLANNRNKRGIVLDLKDPAARPVLRRLVERSDVVLHSIRSAPAARLGLSWEALSAINPRLVLCQALGFGEAGPYAGRPAYDDIVQSLSGLAMLQQGIAGVPRYLPSIIGDKVTALHAALATVTALFHRERTGLGQQVRIPMLETIVAFTSAEHLGGAVFEPMVGQMGYAQVRKGLRRPFRTADGWVCMLPYSDRDWRRFLELAGRPDLAQDPGWATIGGRQAQAEALWTQVAAFMLTRTSADWLAVLREADIPSAPVQSLEDLLDDPHLAATGFWEMHDHPTEGRLRFPASPLGLAASPPSIRRLPPRLGEHTAEVMREIGLGG
jgi:crotonobetainyl-CoA:carnitine CoA-transferase CaiB-like acyl-CoA transferase